MKVQLNFKMKLECRKKFRIVRNLKRIDEGMLRRMDFKEIS